MIISGEDMGLKRISIVLDEDLIKKLRKVQANKIVKSDKSVSLSKVVSEILKKSI